MAVKLGIVPALVWVRVWVRVQVQVQVLVLVLAMALVLMVLMVLMEWVRCPACTASSTRCRAGKSTACRRCRGGTRRKRRHPCSRDWCSRHRHRSWRRRARSPASHRRPALGEEARSP